VNTQRALAVFAAVMIVVSVALGTFEVHPRELGELLADIDAAMLSRVQAFIVRWFGDWTWHVLAMPLMQRPAWLPPASLAILAIGLALTRSGGKTTNRSRRRS